MARYSGITSETVVSSLLDAINDKDEEVRSSLGASLHSFGTKKPEIVLSACSSYLTKHSKLPVTHRILVLNVICKTCQQVSDVLPQDLIHRLVKQAAEEMTSSKEVIPDWQNAASNILVTLGTKHCHEVMETILSYFQPGIIPHFFIVQTLANLSSANVYGIVPFLKAILGTLLPMLGMLRADNMKWVTSFALAKFSEAIIEYIANIDKAPDPTVKTQVFATEISVAFDIVLGWIQTKESKLRASVAEAIGYMTYLLPKEKLDEQLPRLIPVILNMLKRHPESQAFSQSLYLILEASIQNNCSALDLQSEQIIHSLFPQACVSPDYMKPSTVKNHNEIMRCFCLLVQSYPNSVTQTLFTALESNAEKSKIGSLIILRHIINTSDACIAERKTSLFNALDHVLNDNNNKVKKVLAHLIVALAHHSYLEDEIGPLLIEFLVRQCTLTDKTTKKSSAIDEDNDAAIQLTCENILNLLTTTVPRIEKILWPHLLEYLLSDKYVNAVPVLCKNIAHLAAKLREQNSVDFDIDFNKNPHVPKPCDFFAKLIVLLGFSNSDPTSLTNILHLMKAISPIINKNLTALWDMQIPKLLKEVTGQQNDVWNQNILEFLGLSLDEIDQEKWVKFLCVSLMKQLPSLTSPYQRGFCMKCLGVSLKKISDENFVDKNLDKIFNSVQHVEKAERQGCAVAFGRTSIAHFSLVLAKLDALKKLDSSRRSSGILSFFMDSKVDMMQELTKATLILCYGSIARYAPVSLVISHVDMPILSQTLLYFQQAKEAEVKQSLLQMITELAQALYLSMAGKPFEFNSRKDVFQNVLNVLNEDLNPSLTGGTKTKIMALSCITSLIKLNPPLLGSEKEMYLKHCIESVYKLLEEDDKSMEIPKQSAVDSLNSLLSAALLNDLTPDNLYLIILNLDTPLHSVRPSERKCSIHAIHVLLKLFLENVSVGLGKPLTFGPLGAIVARLIPRCTDSILSVRQVSIECISVTFQISAIYDGLGRNFTDASLHKLSAIQNEIITDNPTTLYALTKDIGQVLAIKLPVHHVASFLHVMYEGLVDDMNTSSCGVCVVLNSVIKERGGELHQQVEVLMKLLIHKMGFITCMSTRKGLLQVLRTLASHHLMGVTNFLLNSPCYDVAVIDCWRSLAQESSLGCNILENLLEMIERSSPVTNHADPRNNQTTLNVVNPQIMSAVLAMKEIFFQAEMEDSSIKLFSRICASLISLYGSFIGAYAANPSNFDTHKEKGTWPPVIISEKKMDSLLPIRAVIEVFQAFLLCAKQESVLNEIIEDKAALLSDPNKNFLNFITCLSRSLCIYTSPKLPKIVSYLNPLLTSTLDNHRIVVAAFFAELINQRCCGDSALLELLLNSLINCLMDSSHMVRRLSIRGLGCIGKVGADEVHKYSTTVMSAMLAGLDDKDDPNSDIALEAMNGLSKVLSEIDASLVNPLLINIVLKIRPGFENVRPEIRASSFILFGDLAKFSKTEDESPFVEQIHNTLIALLLHLHDEDEHVIKACKYALRLIGPSLGSEGVNNMFQRHLRDDAVLYYEEFINDLIKLLVSDLPEKIPLYIATNSTYFKSIWPIMQGNAAMFIGFLIGNVSANIEENIAKDSICTALLGLLKSPVKEVRMKAAMSIAALYSM